MLDPESTPKSGPENGLRREGYPLFEKKNLAIELHISDILPPEYSGGSMSQLCKKGPFYCQVP